MKREKGFTLVEIVMVILLVGILSVVAIPNFIDFRANAKDNATKNAVGGLRSAVSIAIAAIALKENPAATNAPTTYPSFNEMNGNSYLAAAPSYHVVLTGTAIMATSSGVPSNSWTGTSTIHNCSGDAKGTLLAAPNNNDGWCYDPTTGNVWANSNLSTGGTTENNF